MLIAFIVILLFFILLSVAGAAARKRQEEQARLHLTAEHQRLQREAPEHPDANMGLEEFFLSRTNELRVAQRRNLRAILRYGGIGAVGVAVIAYIWGITMSYDGFPLSLIFSLSFFGLAIGGFAGAVTVMVKFGRPKLRIKTEQ